MLGRQGQRGATKWQWLCFLVIFFYSVFHPIAKGASVEIFHVADFPQVTKSSFSLPVENIPVYNKPVEVNKESPLVNGTRQVLMQMAKEVCASFDSFIVWWQNRRDRYCRTKCTIKRRSVRGSSHIDRRSGFSNKCGGCSMTEHLVAKFVNKNLLKALWWNKIKLPNLDPNSWPFFADKHFNAVFSGISGYLCGFGAEPSGLCIFLGDIQGFSKDGGLVSHAQSLTTDGLVGSIQEPYLQASNN